MMKRSRKDVRGKAVVVPEVKFECQSLTSFSGLVIWQRFFTMIGLKRRLDQCLRHLSGGKIYTPATIFLQLIVHVMLGFRELRDRQYYADDPLVQRVLGLKRLPDVATVSRMLTNADERSVENLRRLLRGLVQELADEEAEHYNLFKTLSERPDIKNYIDESIQTPPSDHQFSDYIQQPDLGEHPSDQDVLLYALGREQAAMEQYSTLASEVSPGPVADLFRFLAQEELEHKKELEKLYYRLVHSGGV